MRSEVQLLPGPPIRGLSSVGRAVALQASGRRFDPDRLHHFRPCGVEMVDIFPEMKTRVQLRLIFGGFAPSLTL